MSFRKFFAWKRFNGIVFVTALILLSVILSTMTIALAVANRTYEGHAIVISSINRENIANQSFSIVEKWFYDSIKNGEIPLSESTGRENVPNTQPVFHLPSHLLEPIFMANEISEIKAFVVDANYSSQAPEIDLSEAIFIEPHTYEIKKENFDIHHYFLNVFVKLHQDDNVQLQLNKEVLVLKNELKPIAFVNSASTKQLVKTTN